MKLKLKNVKDYVLGIDRAAGRRNHLTVHKVADGILTGDNWTEPFDSYTGVPAELESRFNARIGKQDREPVRTDDVVVDEYDAMLKAIVEPVLSVAVHDAVNNASARLAALEDGKDPGPVQNIVERVLHESMARVFLKTHPLFERIIRDGQPASRRWRIFKRR